MSDFSHTILQRWASSGRLIEDQHTHSGDAQDSRDIDVPDSTTDQEVDFVLDVSEIKGLYITSDQALLIETNDSGAPVEQYTLIASQPLIWYNGSYHACPFLTDITKLFLTNASGASARLQLEVVYDSTP